MTAKHLWIALIFALGASAASACGAVQLASLTTPTLQTLIDMGSTPVAVGPYQFSDFTFVDASTGATRPASQIQVQAFATGSYGMQFVANWFAANGSMIDDVISFDVLASIPSESVGQISLLSNGTAPVPVNGTFATTTLLASLPGGATAAPLLSTYNDGSTSPVDTTKPDTDYVLETLAPAEQLHIIDTLFAISTPSGTGTSGGVATASVLQNAFAPASIPEPSHPGWIFLPLAVVVSASGRQFRRSVK